MLGVNLFRMQLETKESYNNRILQINKKSADFDVPHLCSTNNLSKNRYADIYPEDHTRVILSNKDNDYINATKYENLILTQGPTVATVKDLWLMAFENQAEIVCLTAWFENNCIKTENYWSHPTDIIVNRASNNSEEEGDYDYVRRGFVIDTVINDDSANGIKRIRVERAVPEETETPDEQQGILTSLFFVTVTNEDGSCEKREIKRLFTSGWKDGAACAPELVVKFLQQMQEPAIIHCSAGVGRSGVLAITHHFVSQYQKAGAVPSEDEIDNEILELRKLRPLCVQTGSQRKLISEAINKYIETTSDKK